MKRNFGITFLLAALLLSLTTGCSSFHRDWRKAAKIPPTGIAGRWEGTWTSIPSRHEDKLRCLMTPISENTYEARFHAKYHKVLSFGYTATFTGSYSNNVFTFAGEADLGKLAGGIYQYAGNVNQTNFYSTYNSKYDHGTFQMHRPR